MTEKTENKETNEELTKLKIEHSDLLRIAADLQAKFKECNDRIIDRVKEINKIENKQ